MLRKIEVVINITLAICAVAIAAAFVTRAVGSSRSELALDPPSRVAEWPMLANGGHLIGSSTAALQIVEFGDFECPFCRVFHENVETLIDENPDDVSLRYYHYPLRIHRFAEAAAWASECAADHDRFPTMARALFANQASIGLKPWNDYALEAGITDTGSFSDCMESDTIAQRVERHRQLGIALSVTATPTVIINGWRYPLPPSLKDLRELLTEALQQNSTSR